MSNFNLLDMAKSYFSNEIISKASAHLGESESGISKIVSAALPSLIGTIADKASSSPDNANAILKMATEQNDSGILSNLGNFLGGDNGNNLLGKSSGIISSLFGNGGDSNMLTTLISKFAGAKSSSVGTIISMAAPALLGLIGKFAKTNNTSASGLSSLLGDQKRMAMSALPSGFSLSSLTGQAANTVRTATAAASNTYHEVEEKTSGIGKFLLPLFLVAALAIGAWYLLKDGCNKKTGDTTTTIGTDTTVNSTTTTTTTTTTTDTTSIASNLVKAISGAVDTLTGDFNYNEGDITTITLPNAGGELKVGANSTEAKLCAFLNDKNAVIDTAKGNWFEFTNVHFKTGGAALTDASASQLKNMVAIAKAYPNAKFKFGGYTDNTGDAAKNVTLSQQRALTVSNMVKKLGASASSFVDAKGFGDAYPIGDNNTAEGRAMNRRVAVNVKAK